MPGGVIHPALACSFQGTLLKVTMFLRGCLLPSPFPQPLKICLTFIVVFKDFFLPRVVLKEEVTVGSGAAANVFSSVT